MVLLLESCITTIVGQQGEKEEEEEKRLEGPYHHHHPHQAEPPCSQPCELTSYSMGALYSPSNGPISVSLKSVSKLLSQVRKASSLLLLNMPIPRLHLTDESDTTD